MRSTKLTPGTAEGSPAGRSSARRAAGSFMTCRSIAARKRAAAARHQAIARVFLAEAAALDTRAEQLLTGSARR